MQRAFAELRPASEFAQLEAAARSRSESDWIVGMNATRAATIRLRSSFDGAVSLGRVQTPTLAIITRREEEIRAFVPEPYWLVDARLRGARRARLRGPLPRRRQAAPGDRRGRPTRSSPPSAARPARSRSSRRKKRTRARAAALRPHVAAARGQQPLRLHRPAHARRRAALLRGAQGAHVSAHELALPDERHDRRAQADRRPRRRARGASTRPPPRTSRASTCCRSARVVADDKVGDHHAIIPTNSTHDARQALRRRPPHLRPRRAPLPRRLPSRGGVREHEGRDDGRRPHLPHARQGPARARLARRLRRARRGRRAPTDDDEGRDQQLPKLERGEDVETRDVTRGREGDQAAAALLRRLAAGRDGDRRQARRRRRDARGDEGVGHRHAGDARVDHRAPHRRRLRRARRALARRDREGPERHPPARRAPADVAVADRRLGAAARR